MQSISKIFNASWLENITQKSGNSSLITISLRVIVKVESQVQLARNGKKKKERKERKKNRKRGGEKKNKKYLAWHPSVCVHVHGPCTGLEWNYLLVIHVEWRTNGFDVKNERAFLLFPRRVTVVFLTA